MNPAQIIDLLTREDIIELVEILKSQGKNILEIAGDLDMERRTIYNFKDTKDINNETKRKFVKHFLLNDRDTIYLLLRKKLEFALSDLLLDIYSRKFIQVNKAAKLDQPGKVDELRILYKEITEYDFLLAKKTPNRYFELLEKFGDIYEQEYVPSVESFDSPETTYLNIMSFPEIRIKNKFAWMVSNRTLTALQDSYSVRAMLDGYMLSTLARDDTNNPRESAKAVDMEGKDVQKAIQQLLNLEPIMAGVQCNVGLDSTA